MKHSFKYVERFDRVCLRNAGLMIVIDRGEVLAEARNVLRPSIIQSAERFYAIKKEEEQEPTFEYDREKDVVSVHLKSAIVPILHRGVLPEDCRFEPSLVDKARAFRAKQGEETDYVRLGPGHTAKCRWIHSTVPVLCVGSNTYTPKEDGLYQDVPPAAVEWAKKNLPAGVGWLLGNKLMYFGDKPNMLRDKEGQVRWCSSFDDKTDDEIDELLDEDQALRLFAWRDSLPAKYSYNLEGAARLTPGKHFRCTLTKIEGSEMTFEVLKEDE